MPSLALSVVDPNAWIDATDGQFLPLWTRAERPPPPVVTKVVSDISDRASVLELHRRGLTRVDAMRASNARLARWIVRHCTLEDVCAPHRGTLDDGCLAQ
jgi:hypothetical protein